VDDVGEVVRPPLPPPAEPAPPQAPAMARPITHPTRVNTKGWDPFLLVPKNKRITAKVVTGTSGDRCRVFALLVLNGTEIVRVVATAPPPARAVTVVGEKLHDAPPGSPVQENKTVWSK
jgi:hypothetical protein